ncbi:Protein kinase c inhibitor [Gryllus bimaculatus]|nr:Protein kinase c inhibitor [Gryllus bimaculatus]
MQFTKASLRCFFSFNRAIIRRQSFQIRRLYCTNEINRAQSAKRNRPMVTIFEQIIKREIPADIVYEDEKCLAFKDVNPQAPTHLLLIPKKRIPMISDAVDSDQELLGYLMLIARRLANERLQKGYRLVYHLHIHILGGRQLGWPPG